MGQAVRPGKPSETSQAEEVQLDDFQNHRQ